MAYLHQSSTKYLKNCLPQYAYDIPSLPSFYLDNIFISPSKSVSNIGLFFD